MIPVRCQCHISFELKYIGTVISYFSVLNYCFISLHCSSFLDCTCCLGSHSGSWSNAFLILWLCYTSNILYACISHPSVVHPFFNDITQHAKHWILMDTVRKHCFWGQMAFQTASKTVGVKQKWTQIGLKMKAIIQVTKIGNHQNTVTTGVPQI